MRLLAGTIYASIRSMPAALDISAYPPDGMEVRLIERFTTLKGRRILEVGCGDGRLTFQYAPTAREVLAFDPDRASIEDALDEQAALGVSNVDFRVGSIEHLPARGAPFDIALFSWSL
ncbi:MAG: class I SAM-dependent methyltransferase [Chloroflexi bacterium]|nr:MAG: class I SAM-dependent methyltransferase [Chloroflexota bacterium]